MNWCKYKLLPSPGQQLQSISYCANFYLTPIPPVVSHSHGRKKGLTGRMPVKRLVRLVAIQKRRDGD